MITVAVDGSALGNPGPAGWAWYINEDCWAAGGWPRATNNLGELTAIAAFLRTYRGGEDIEFLCDSRYAIDSITSWMPAWKKRGWRKADGQEVKNLEVMQELDELLAAAKTAGQEVKFTWVRGHSGHLMNEAADEKARGIAAVYQRQAEPTSADTGPGFTAPKPAATEQRADTESVTAAYSIGDCAVFEHRFRVPLDHFAHLSHDPEKITPVTGVTAARPAGDWQVDFHGDTDPADAEIVIFAREIIAPDGSDKPYAIYFQGGPGCPGNRATDWQSGWIGELLKHFRLIMLDQRGTGASTPLEKETILALGQRAEKWLTLMRADQIVADAEAIRQALGLQTWTVVGQSFGGFIITAYLSRNPAAIERAFICGGLPGLCDVDQIYRQTFAQIVRRNEEFLADERMDQRLREVAAHIEAVPEYLPGGELLTTARLRSIGMNLGRTAGLATLRYLLEDPFVTVNGTRRLSQIFLAAIDAQVSVAARPLYVLLHETIYARAVACAGATNWAADRIREEFPSLSLSADPARPDIPYHLSGECFGRWTVAADPGLEGLGEVAEALAARQDWPLLYDREALERANRPVFAAVYPDDVFVPYRLSLDTAAAMGAQVHEFPDYHHDGISASGTKVIRTLLDAAGLHAN